MALNIDRERTDAMRGFMDELKDDLIDKMRHNRQVATGDTIRALKVVVENRGATGVLLGPDYLNALETGRGPTRNGGDGSLLEAIKRWAQAKGIPEEAAYPITRKIHQEGTLLFRNRQDTRLLKDTLTDDRIKAFIGAFSETALSEVRSQIILPNLTQGITNR